MDAGAGKGAHMTHHATAEEYGDYLLANQLSMYHERQFDLECGQSSTMPGKSLQQWVSQEVGPLVYNYNEMNNTHTNSPMINMTNRTMPELFLQRSPNAEASRTHPTETTKMQQTGVSFMNVSGDAPMSYMQLLLAAEQEGAKYFSSQSQEERLVRTENDMFMITGCYGRGTSEEPRQPTHDNTGRVLVEQNQEPFLFVDNTNIQGLHDLIWETDEPDCAQKQPSDNELDSDSESDHNLGQHQR
ncbi:uncharacterized protein [Aegilops tauschii subsp. strangulata]|uniref:uncharacterized protein n=1 Tax=Aegilops tauschii subsp. strangulata TaxID=200361 RepID=UPI00098B5787|nr:uncharacterized protein LOC123123071 isoform X2 [Triticum aestivum]XP_045085162.1 uncharacterized protein LOC109763785 isoform X3 [Aegilops tauschii subsp. strangulata]